MRIEIMGGSSSGTSTISGLHMDFDSLLTETDSVIDALNKLKSFSYNMSGGIGILQDAVGNVDGRLQAEEMLDPNAWEDAADLTSGDVKVVRTVEPSYVEYGETVSTYVDIAKIVNEFVDDLETGFWLNQQKGSGSCYIYNH